MKNLHSIVACGGMDVHYKFSNVTFRDNAGNIVRRQRLAHPQRKELQERLSRWPKALPVVMEASFGWGWLGDLMEEAGLQVHLSNCYKVEQMRKARGWPKTNKKDADLTSMLPFEQTDWWQVWRAPRQVRNRREQMRFRGGLVGLQTMVKSRIHAIFHRHGISLLPKIVLAVRLVPICVFLKMRDLKDVEEVIASAPIDGAVGVERFRNAFRRHEVIGRSVRLTEQLVSIVHDVIHVVPHHFDEISVDFNLLRLAWTADGNQ